MARSRSKLGKVGFFFGGCGISGDGERSGEWTGEGGVGGAGGAGGAGGDGGLCSPLLFQKAWSLAIASSSEQPKRLRMVSLVASKAADSHRGWASSAIIRKDVF